MAKLIYEPGIGKMLSKKIYGNKILIHKSWDVKHGRGWFVFAYPEEIWKERGVGFSKNRFTAVRNALKDIKLTKNHHLYL